MTKEEKKKEKYPPEDIRVLYDFKYNALKETAMVLAKGITYYITIFLGIIGYIFTQKVEGDIKNVALITIICMSVAILGAALYITWGLITGLKSLQELLEFSNPKLYEELKVSSFFKRGKLVVKMVIFFSAIVLFALVYAFANL